MVDVLVEFDSGPTSAAVIEPSRSRGASCESPEPTVAEVTPLTTPAWTATFMGSFTAQVQGDGFIIQEHGEDSTDVSRRSASGEVEWSVSLAGVVGLYTVCDSVGLAAGGGQILGLDLVSGATMWSIEAPPDRMLSSLVPTDDGTAHLVWLTEGARSSTISTLDPWTGTVTPEQLLVEDPDGGGGVQTIVDYVNDVVVAVDGSDEAPNVVVHRLSDGTRTSFAFPYGYRIQAIDREAQTILGSDGRVVASWNHAGSLQWQATVADIEGAVVDRVGAVSPVGGERYLLHGAGGGTAMLRVDDDGPHVAWVASADQAGQYVESIDAVLMMSASGCGRFVSIETGVDAFPMLTENGEVEPRGRLFEWEWCYIAGDLLSLSSATFQSSLILELSTGRILHESTDTQVSAYRARNFVIVRRAVGAEATQVDVYRL